MFGKTSVTALVLMICASGYTAAQTPERLDQFDYWGAYSYNARDNKVCYILSTPTEQTPATVKHGDNFFLVSKRTEGGLSFEPQFMAGYNLREGSQVTVSAGNHEFVLFTRGSSAWVDSTYDEEKLLAEMKAGKTMTVKAVSQRGTNTSYTYSLKGVTAALKAIQKCK